MAWKHFTETLTISQLYLFLLNVDECLTDVNNYNLSILLLFILLKRMHYNI